MESLDVYLNGVRAGRLDDDNGRLSFAYSDSFLANGGREPLSHSLPLRTAAFVHAEIEPFLSNLLPDDIIRTRLGEILKIPRENTFALLRAIGGDCAGAISFFTSGTAPDMAAQPRFRKLTDEEAGQILGNLEKRPLDVGEAGFRISGAGAQDKLIACYRDGGVLLPLDGTPSTHIIKPAMRDYPDSVENEWFAMTLAAMCGLRTAECGIAVIGGKRRYLCRRYDREESDGIVRRLHQEDFCQMLGIDPGRKYEAIGGPGIADSFRLLREMALPATDTVEFLDRVIFNFLVGNGDAHGKNFSILYRNGVPSLAPLYDVMSTAIYPEVGRRMAMKIDGEYDFRWITIGKFRRMAEKVGIGLRILERELAKMVRRINSVLPKLVRRAAAEHPSKCYDLITDGISRRIGQIEL